MQQYLCKLSDGSPAKVGQVVAQDIGTTTLYYVVPPLFSPDDILFFSEYCRVCRSSESPVFSIDAIAEMLDYGDPVMTIVTRRVLSALADGNHDGVAVDYRALMRCNERIWRRGMMFVGLNLPEGGLL